MDNNQAIFFILLIFTIHPNLSFANDTDTSELQGFMTGLRFDAFDFSLCEALYVAKPETNVAVSPVSVKIVLAMLYEAAEGDTANELQKVLNLPESKNASRIKFGNIIKSLKTELNSTKIKLGSRLFVPLDSDTASGYIRVLQRHFAADINSIDFTQPQKAAKLINNWVNQTTEGKITSMMDPNDPNIPNLNMVISNAIFFKGKWQSPFDPKKTNVSEFHIRENNIVNVPFMQKTDLYYYVENVNDGYALIRIPYASMKYAMYIVLPFEKYGVDTVLSTITPDGVRTTMETMKLTNITLHLPKFSFQLGIDLEPILTHLGIQKLFDKSGAELPMISKKTQVYVSRILHKVGLEINELGSTFVSATNVNVINRFMLEKPILVRVDHPFMFFIKDDSAETIVFASKIENPLEITKKGITTTTPPPTTNFNHSNITTTTSRFGNQRPTFISRPTQNRNRSYTIKKVDTKK